MGYVMLLFGLLLLIAYVWLFFDIRRMLKELAQLEATLKARRKEQYAPKPNNEVANAQFLEDRNPRGG